jgi:acetylornithine deacetylase
VAKNKHDNQDLLIAPALIADLNALLSIASMGGTDAEQQAQEFMAKCLREAGLEVHTWDIDLARITADPQFPGQEVERARGLGVLGI